ncbi:hypothetical protein E0H73_28650 [Kribbella pittospori]|uniref:Uncharacterized protein n=1 Tax=Kribbella pittospori TaxID=722689 RepID=A0A4R0KQU1_9ACTN|nr:hypothetical protein E0H73_28650 [Kribbella pittospori]
MPAAWNGFPTSFDTGSPSAPPSAACCICRRPKSVFSRSLLINGGIVANSSSAASFAMPIASSFGSSFSVIGAPSNFGNVVAAARAAKLSSSPLTTRAVPLEMRYRATAPAATPAGPPAKVAA